MQIDKWLWWGRAGWQELRDFSDFAFHCSPCHWPCFRVVQLCRGRTHREAGEPAALTQRWLRPSQYGMMDRALGQTKPKLPRTPGMAGQHGAWPFIHISTTEICSERTMPWDLSFIMFYLPGWGFGTTKRPGRSVMFASCVCAVVLWWGGHIHDDRPVPGVKGQQLSGDSELSGVEAGDFLASSVVNVWRGNFTSVHKHSVKLDCIGWIKVQIL